MFTEVLIAARRRLDPIGLTPLFISFFSSLADVIVSGLSDDFKGTSSARASSFDLGVLEKDRIVLAD